MKPVVFFDLDGVLADFVSGALRHHNRTDVSPASVVWGIEKQLGLDPAAFWAPLSFEFWANLEPYADGMELLRAAEGLVGSGNIGLLTSPCDTEGCVEGKRAWVKRHLPAYSRRLMVGPAKELFAGPTKILVDDHDVNCDKFVLSGGRAVQPPRPWNSFSSECKEDGGFDVPRLTAVLAGVVGFAKL